MPDEFHNLAERLLNHESEGRTVWGNLGHWRTAHSYPEACAALADQLAERMRLNPDDRLVDLGFGCGDQLLHWHHQYGVQWMAGLNLSQSQTQLARSRLEAAGLSTGRLCAGSAATLSAWAAATRITAVSAVVALDCAYHFENRAQTLCDAAALLRPGGRLGVSDLILARPPRGAVEHSALWMMCRLSRIPAHNLLIEDGYRAQWHAAGLEITDWKDLTPHVFRPFGDWLHRYRAAMPPARSAGARWGKYTATARFLAWADRRRLLRYIVCVGTRR
jgi:cyclopropane fatty-acyl-phospholipid synthase-like methyltransferase